MSKTLYVSDLDGTLLRRDQTLSQLTVDTINDLVARGMIFSYATARSLVTARQATEGLSVNIPVIVYNGTFVMESQTGRRLLSHTFSPKDATDILDVLLRHEVYPIVYSLIDGVEKFSYVKDRQSRGVAWFNGTRRGDVRDNPVTDATKLYQGEIFHFTCIDEEAVLLPLYEQFRNRFSCVFHRDIYSGDPWLEIQPIDTSKAQAIRALQRSLGCDTVVCFGDGRNDVSMFEIADECYAVSNADAALLRMATAVIESNEEDGVAKWLKTHAHLSADEGR